MSNLEQLDKDHIWHPFTQPPLEAPPFLVERSSGARLYGGGREIIDAISSWWLTIHGHSHPYIAEKINLQLQKLHHVIFAGFTHEPAINLATRLLEILPGNPARIFFSDDGSTAVEAALKMALQFWHNRGEQRTKILALDGSYHGDTFGAMSVSSRGDGSFVGPFERFLFDVTFLPLPTEENSDAALTALERELASGDVAAFIFEPLVQGAGGMRLYSNRVLDQMIALCRENRVVTVADEVFTGFGRTGNLFACNYLSMAPDIFCLSKGLTGGTLPMGVTAATDEIYNAFVSNDRHKMLMHGHSFTANPICCTAGLASLDLLETDECQSNIKRVNLRHREFCDYLRSNSKVEHVRSLGTIMAFNIKVEGQTSYYQPLRDKLYRYALERGVLLRPLGNVLYTCPPYCISDEELSVVYKVLEGMVDEFA